MKLLVEQGIAREITGKRRGRRFVHEPSTWTRPWTARVFMRPSPGTGVLYGFACHEGNYAIEHVLRNERHLETEASR